MRNLSVELRPKTFDEIVGLRETVSALKNQLATGNVSVAYLFSGDRGLGKTTLALILAREVQGKNFQGEPEVQEINAADDTGIAAMRILIENSVYRPFSGQYRVIILDEVHQLSTDAQNALLTPLEDKNSPTVWILCTTNPQKVIPTLRDRCTAFALTPPDKKGREWIASQTLGIAAPGFSQLYPILEAIEYAEVSSPREIIQAVEKYANGLSPEQAVQSIDTDPAFVDIARAVMSKKWSQLAPLLKKVKAADIKGLKQVIAGFLRADILNSPPSAFETKIKEAETLKQLALYSSYEAGVDLSATCAILYLFCQKR